MTLNAATGKVALGATLLAAVTFLSACAGAPKPATVEGVCDVFRAPDERYEAVTREGQLWIDGILEAGVRVCDWPRSRY